MSFGSISAMSSLVNSFSIKTTMDDEQLALSSTPSLIESIGSSIAAFIAAFHTPTPAVQTHPVERFPKHQSLEDPLKDQICVSVDIKANCGFRDYLSPNEETPKNVKTHLDPMSQGLIVSTGTERSFYDLLLSNEDKCTGLVVRDINPRVKAYVDFVTLLLRISDTREEFLELSGNPAKGRFDERFDLIKSKLLASDVPQPMKDYYLKNLFDFGKIYFPVTHLPESGDNTSTDFRSDDRLFAKLQRYAKAGSIVATIGDINNLYFLGDQKVAVVDTSNICDYITLDIKGNNEFNPIVIWTKVGIGRTFYHSYPLKDE